MNTNTGFGRGLVILAASVAISGPVIAQVAGEGGRGGDGLLARDARTLYGGGSSAVGREKGSTEGVTARLPAFTWLRVDVSLEGKSGSRIRFDYGTGPDRTFVCSYRAVPGGLDLKVGRGGDASGLVSRASYGAPADMPGKSLLLWGLRTTIYFDNERFLRMISQRDLDTELRLDSALFGWEVDIGTQWHIGMELGVGPNAASPDQELTTFMRFSYLLGIWRGRSGGGVERWRWSREVLHGRFAARSVGS